MIRSDRGSYFANDLIKELLDLTGTPHNLTLAYSSQENAIVECNKEINRHLKGLVFDTPSLVHYAKCTPFVQRIINSSDNKRTGASPASILFADKLDLNRGILTPCDSSGFKVPILPDSTTVHYPPYTTVCCIVVAIYSLHVEVNPSF